MLGLSRGEQVLIIVALALVVAGGAGLYLRERGREGPVPELVVPVEAEKKEKDDARIKVDVKGAVWNPGVYDLPKGSRVQDALELAMPMTGKADLNAINRARVLTDQGEVIVPFRGQETGKNETSSGARIRRGKVNLNTAALEELKSLPGIGDKRAESIIRYREEHGPFRKIEDLRNVSGIRVDVYDSIKGELTVE